MTQPRKPAGASDGGQFSHRQHAEPTAVLTLDPSDDPSGVSAESAELTAPTSPADSTFGASEVVDRVQRNVANAEAEAQAIVESFRDDLAQMPGDGGVDTYDVLRRSNQMATELRDAGDRHFAEMDRLRNDAVRSLRSDDEGSLDRQMILLSNWQAEHWITSDQVRQDIAAMSEQISRAVVDHGVTDSDILAAVARSGLANRNKTLRLGTARLSRLVERCAR